MKNVLEPTDGGGMLFNCPGCDMLHVVYVGAKGDRPVLVFNGDMKRPTFSPSVLVKYPWGTRQEEKVCHSFINDGRIQYLTDCTHHLAGKTVDLPAWDSDF